MDKFELAAASTFIITVFAIILLWLWNMAWARKQVMQLRRENRTIQWSDAVNRVRAGNGKFTTTEKTNELWWVSHEAFAKCERNHSNNVLENQSSKFLWAISTEEYGMLVLDRPCPDIHDSLSEVGLENSLVVTNVYLW